MIVTKENYGITHFTTSPLVCHPDNSGRPVDIKNFKGHHLTMERDYHRQHVLTRASLPGEYLEFGVYRGHSINDIAKSNPRITVHGFDSFEGLPEDWILSEDESTGKAKPKIFKGFFRLERLPLVEPNVRLWKGWFSDTLPRYIEEVNPKQIAFLHVDSDLYSSATTVLDCLNDYIVKDTVILFDDFYPFGRKPYDMWAEGEYKALKEWTEKFDREFIVLSHNMHQQTAIKMIK